VAAAGFGERPLAGGTLEGMSTSSSSSGASLGKRALALVILLIAAWILFKVVIGIVAFAATAIVVVLAIVAVIWAIRVL
jgi:hypothetical protein